MNNPFVMRTEALYSLNFLIYIQNLYLNQTQQGQELKFPFISRNLSFHKDFEVQFNELWNEVAKNIIEHPENDGKWINEEIKMVSERLFIKNESGLENFKEVYQSFQVWWDSFSGRFAIERSVEAENDKVYRKLLDLLERESFEPQGTLSVSLLFDDSSLIDAKPSAYSVIVPIKKYFLDPASVLADMRAAMQ